MNSLEKHFRNDRMVLDLHGNLGNDNSYAIIVDGNKIHYELMDKEKNVVRFSTPEELEERVSNMGFTISMDFKGTSMAMQAFSDIVNTVIYTDKPVINYAELMRAAGQKMIKTSMKKLGYTLINQSVFRPDEIDSKNSNFIKLYLDNLDKTISEAITYHNN